MAQRFVINPSRIILDTIKINGPMTRNELFAKIPREQLLTRGQIVNVTRYLHKNKRLVAYLPIGKVKGIDPWMYKLNPFAERVNFPQNIPKKKKAKREMELAEILKNTYAGNVTHQEESVRIRSETEGFFDPLKN